jgi:hypothetical protein
MKMISELAHPHFIILYTRHRHTFQDIEEISRTTPYLICSMEKTTAAINPIYKAIHFFKRTNLVVALPPYIS